MPRRAGPPAIHVYTCVKVVKVRRVGNSNVVSLPRELAARGYTPGASVLVEELEGELRIMPTDQVRDRIRGVGQRVVAERAEALKILADHDPDSERAQQQVPGDEEARGRADLSRSLPMRLSSTRRSSAAQLPRQPSFATGPALRAHSAGRRPYAHYEHADFAPQVAVLAHGVAESQTHAGREL